MGAVPAQAAPGCPIRIARPCPDRRWRSGGGGEAWSMPDSSDAMESPELGERGGAPPAGEVYDWYVRGRDLLGSGDAAAAVQVLAHIVAAEPSSRSAREMLARAQ